MKNIYTLLLLTISLLAGSNLMSAPVLNSYPSAQATIYFDFDGELVQGTIWNGGNTINCASSGFTDAEITTIFLRIAEDFRPFNINITTDEAKYLSAPMEKRIRIIVTPTNFFRPGVGGSAYTGSFNWGDDTPGFVFPNMLGMSTKYVAEACTHEAGHTLFLSHQSKYDNSCNIVQSYNEGTGTGETAWAPVMGNSYYRNQSGWNNGPTPSGCTESQDNLSIITGYNSFGYRSDDHSSKIDSASTTINFSGNTFNETGVISTSADIDYFSLSIVQNSSFHFDAKPFSIGANNEGANLDVKVCLLNSAKQVIRIYDPIDIMNISVDTVLNSGSYYLMIKGAGNLYSSEYGSLGSYTISGAATPLGVTPIRDISLKAKAVNGRHQLDWTIISDEPIVSLAIETSINGAAFTSLAQLPAGTRSYINQPSTIENISYRLKIVSTANQLAYSNIVMLRSSKTAEVIVPTLVNNYLTVIATTAYEFNLVDVNGRTLSAGKRLAGRNMENTDRLPSGMYVLQIITNNETTIKRIIKQ